MPGRSRFAAASSRAPRDSPMTYADLAMSAEVVAALGKDVRADVALTGVTDWKVLGESVARPNVRDLVTGAHRFPSDVVRPGMLYGRVLRPPAYGSTLESIDLSAPRAMDDVVVVREGPFVGFAAPSTHRATQALEAAARTASWKTSDSRVSNATLFEHLREHAQPERGRTDESGSTEKALQEANRVLREEYRVAYIQHAPMEPRAAAAEWKDDRLTVWVGCDGPFRAQSALAEELGIPRGPGPGDHARHGRRLRGQAHRRGRRRGSTSGPRRRATGLGAVDPRGGVHLGVLPAGRADRVSRRSERRGLARRLGLHQHQPRRVGPRHAVRDPERPRVLRGLGLSPAPGVLSVPGGHRQQLRPRVLHGRDGRRRRRRTPWSSGWPISRTRA